MRKRNGFTLGEIVTTTAIIGVLSAIAYPNFMRIKMNTNMELVKQHLRTVNEKMVEILGKEGQFPDQGNLVTGGETTMEEIDVTANLSGITNKGYVPDYRLFANGNNYVLFASPRPGLRGISGDKCFITVPARPIAETSCWSAEGLNLLPGYLREPFGPLDFSEFLAHPGITEEHKIAILANLLERSALYEDFMAFYWSSLLGLPPKEGTPSTSLYFQHGLESTFGNLFQAAAEKLEKKRITLSWKEFQATPFKMETPLSGPFGNWENTNEDEIMNNAGSYQGAQIGFTLANRVETASEYNARQLTLLQETMALMATLSRTERSYFQGQLVDYASLQQFGSP